MGKLFTGSVALVTGAAGSGIGRATARRLAQDGAAVAVTDSHEGRTEKTVAELAPLVDTDVKGYVLDVGDRAAIASVVAQVRDELGPIDILINNAAINVVKPIVEYDDESWDAVIEADLTGAYQLIRATLPAMIDAGRGSIVNVSSVASYTSPKGEAPYAAAKAGLQSITRTLAAEVGEFGIRCNAVAPGLVWTRFLEKYADDFQSELAQTPLRRFGNPEEIASVIAFLCSQDASFITGETLVVSGGWHMRA